VIRYVEMPQGEFLMVALW